MKDSAFSKFLKKKEIELGYYNDWNDDTAYTFDSLNISYIRKKFSKTSENDYVKVTISGEKKVVIQLKDKFIKEYMN